MVVVIEDIWGSVLQTMFIKNKRCVASLENHKFSSTRWGPHQDLFRTILMEIGVSIFSAHQIGWT